jgi:hypothetical protein
LTQKYQFGLKCQPEKIEREQKEPIWPDLRLKSKKDESIPVSDGFHREIPQQTNNMILTYIKKRRFMSLLSRSHLL